MEKLERIIKKLIEKKKERVYQEAVQLVDIANKLIANKKVQTMEQAMKFLEIVKLGNIESRLQVIALKLDSMDKFLLKDEEL